MPSPSLRVAVDATPLLGTRTGVARFAAAMFAGLADRPDLDTVGYAITWRGREALAGVLPPSVRPAARPFPARLTRWLWLRTNVPGIERWTGRVDVVHGTAFIPPPAHAPVVGTVHDLTFAHHPEMCDRPTLQFDRLVRRALDRGATIHTVSDFVGREAREHFGVDADRVVRVYEGPVESGAGDAGRGRTLTGAERYVLSLGTVEPRKNLPALVRAFDLVAARDADLHLVLAGPDGWGTAVDELVRAIGGAAHGDRVRQLGFVPEQDRCDLLAGARVFAYPSLYEGFGHPPLEAMSAGVPVVAADAGALPEVLGDAAVLVDPADADALADALVEVAADEDRRAVLRARGLERVRRYDWDDTVTGLVDLYHRVAR